MIAEKTADSAYSEYPITLSHPHFTPARSTPIPGTEHRDSRGDVVRQDYQGTPQRFPPVTAGSQAEEEYYLAQGYERAGKVDPSAWVRAHSDAPPLDYKPQKYPLWRGGQLIMTAQEDPEATEEDLAPATGAAPTGVIVPPVDPATVNALAAAEELNRAKSLQLDRQSDELAKTRQEMAELKAQMQQVLAMKDKRSTPRAKTKTAAKRAKAA